VQLWIAYGRFYREHRWAAAAIRPWRDFNPPPVVQTRMMLITKDHRDQSQQAEKCDKRGEHICS
jgi:hypothetical protein